MNLLYHEQMRNNSHPALRQRLYSFMPIYKKRTSKRKENRSLNLKFDESFFVFRLTRSSKLLRVFFSLWEGEIYRKWMLEHSYTFWIEGKVSYIIEHIVTIKRIQITQIWAFLNSKYFEAFNLLLGSWSILVGTP